MGSNHSFYVLQRGESIIPEVYADCSRGQSRLGLRTYPRVMLTLVELPFSSFTVGGTLRLTVDSGKIQVNDMSPQDRELSPQGGVGTRPLPSELTSPDSLTVLLSRCTSRLTLYSSHLCTRVRLPQFRAGSAGTSSSLPSVGKLSSPEIVWELQSPKVKKEEIQTNICDCKGQTGTTSADRQHRGPL